MAHAWKACWVKALGGSNPPSSANGVRSSRQHGHRLCMPGRPRRTRAAQQEPQSAPSHRLRHGASRTLVTQHFGHGSLQRLDRALVDRQRPRRRRLSKPLREDRAFTPLSRVIAGVWRPRVAVRTDADAGGGGNGLSGNALASAVMTTANRRVILVAVKDAGAVELRANAATASGTNTAISSATKRTIGAPRRTASLTLLNGYAPVGHHEIQRARCSSAQDSSLKALPRLTQLKAPSPSTEAREAFL